jgi:hypothetical protein
MKTNNTKPMKAKRNQRNQNEIENGRKNNRGLKEIKSIFTSYFIEFENFKKSSEIIL